MRSPSAEVEYESLRTWALHPTAVRPSGWALLLRSGLASWLRVAAAGIAERASASVPLERSGHPRAGALAQVLAAMIAEVRR
jgi:hypothetical protein